MIDLKNTMKIMQLIPMDRSGNCMDAKNEKVCSASIRES